MGRVVSDAGRGYGPAMRILLVAALLAALAGCSETLAPPSEAAPQSPLHGHFKAASLPAQERAGDVRIERAGLLFESGVTLFTRTLDPVRGADLISRDGDSYAAAALGPRDLIVELRRVTEESVPAAGQGLCGVERVQYIALAYEGRATTFTLLAFTGEEPPGPQASRSHVCARLGYAAPQGARTREGVVL